jgi:perosamine synthetase
MLGKVKMLVGPLIKKGLVAVNIDPGYVRALVKKPPMIHGGPQARHFPWPRRRHFDDREKQVMVALMDREIKRGGALIYNGPEKRAYCDEFNRFMGGGYSEVVNSGTNALYVALRALDLEPGTEVIVPPITDPGGTMPVPLLGCIPVPADAAPGSLNVSVDQIRAVLTDNTSAIVIAHISGHPVDMDPILVLAAERGIPVVEDCAQAHGAVYKGKMVGSLGDISAFSTMFGKHHATGAQGGIVFTRDTRLFTKVRQITDRGKPYGALGTPGNVVASLNFNQDELSCAIGRVQLQKLPDALKARRAFANAVAAGVRDIPHVTLVEAPQGCESAWWFLMLHLDSAGLDCNNTEFANALNREGIDGVTGGYPFYPTDNVWHRDANVYGTSGLPWSLRQTKPQHYPLPNAHDANTTTVRVDVHEQLGPDEARDLVSAIRKVARHFAR